MVLRQCGTVSRQEAADAEWRAEVERTLRELGYEDTPDGRIMAEMRAALAAGDEAFREWSDEQLRAHESQPDPEVHEFEELQSALAARVSGAVTRPPRATSPEASHLATDSQ